MGICTEIQTVGFLHLIVFRHPPNVEQTAISNLLKLVISIAFSLCFRGLLLWMNECCVWFNQTLRSQWSNNWLRSLTNSPWTSRPIFCSYHLFYLSQTLLIHSYIISINFSLSGLKTPPNKATKYMFFQSIFPLIKSDQLSDFSVKLSY